MTLLGDSAAYTIGALAPILVANAGTHTILWLRGYLTAVLVHSIHNYAIIARESFGIRYRRWRRVNESTTIDPQYADVPKQEDPDQHS